MKYRISINDFRMMKDKKGMMKYDLENRLIDFAVDIVKLTESLPRSATGKYITGQIIRSGTSPALNYGEAQSAESRKDFVHKLKIVVKELRETLVALKIIHRIEINPIIQEVTNLITENNELISIFVKSIETASYNDKLPTSKIINR